MKQPRAWQRMLSGRRLDLLDPTPVDIEIEDIAHGLAFVARWNGQTRGDWPYSVAEHSLLVEEIFTRQTGESAKWRLAALLHDAPEYVIGDMISPVKAAVGPSYGELDLRLTAAVHLRFGLPAVLPVTIKKAIKSADRIFGARGEQVLWPSCRCAAEGVGNTTASARGGADGLCCATFGTFGATHDSGPLIGGLAVLHRFAMRVAVLRHAVVVHPQCDQQGICKNV